jgi:phenylalanyl-tRNA synthetase beta chain
MKIPLEWLKEYVDIKKSPKEIADSFTLLGLLLDKPIENEVLDLEHRMDRADWLSITGCARDLAAKEGLEFNKPKLYEKIPELPQKDDIVQIKVECPELVHRFNTRVFKNIKVKDSPDWLKKRLKAYGMDSINNIVDITNYVMLEIGQPMHAQDLSKFQKREIVIRRAKDGEAITTLLGETVKLDSDVFVLTQNGKPIVLGGIVGGWETGVDSNTTEIVLDAGNYNQVNIRKNSRRLKIQNETVLRYDKFLHPKLTEWALERATHLILELAGGEVYQNIDWYPEELPLRKMDFRYSRLSLLSGIEFEPSKVKDILSRLEYQVLEENNEKLLLEVPYFRTDVEVEDDVVADVIRINGYDKIPSSPVNTAPPADVTPTILKFEDVIRNQMENMELHEHITDPLVKADATKKDQIKLQNSLNSEKSALRQSIYETLYPITELYAKHKMKKVGLFEIGKIYKDLVGRSKPEYGDLEETRVVQVIFQDENLAPKENSDQVKKLLSSLLMNLGIEDIELKTNGSSAQVFNKKSLLGEVTYNSFYLFTEELLKFAKLPKRIKYNFDKIHTEDFSYLIEIGKDFGPVLQEIKDFSKDIQRVEIVDEFQKDKKHKSILVRVSYEGNLDTTKLRDIA